MHTSACHAPTLRPYSLPTMAYRLICTRVACAIQVPDGAIFFMNPHSGPSEATVILAQMTVKAGWEGEVVMNVGGQSQSEWATEDYREKAIFKVP